MSEFLCPTTGKPCVQAQATGEVVTDRLMEYFGMASVKVSALGYFANLEMKIDRPTIDNVRQLHRIYENPEIEPELIKAMIAARDETAREIMPAFIECAQNESGSGEGCTYGTDLETQTKAVDSSLNTLSTLILENLSTQGE